MSAPLSQPTLARASARFANESVTLWLMPLCFWAARDSITRYRIKKTLRVAGFGDRILARSGSFASTSDASVKVSILCRPGTLPASAHAYYSALHARGLGVQSRAPGLSPAAPLFYSAVSRRNSTEK